jgi:hypothetical protein
VTYIWISSLDSLDLVPANCWSNIYICFKFSNFTYNNAKKKKNKTEKNKEVEIIITHLMKRLYAEGTLCLFSGAGHKQAGHKHRHIKITLLAFKFCILPPHLLLPSLRISISHTHFFIKNSLLASQEKQQYCTIILY